MLEYKKILYPVDLSETSSKIIPHVKTVAEKFGAEIYLIFVAKVHEYYIENEKPGEGITKKVMKYVKENFTDLPEDHVHVADGDATEEILSYIEKENVDLIVMATRGRKALDKAIFGSVAASVVRTSPVPVFFVNPFTDKFLN
jgi:nucleotide-binding universal stress UspA family protein